jgi:hypothetical protein
MTKLNIAALAAIASAPPPPEPKVEGAVSTDTTLTWPAVPGVNEYRVRWRRTDANNWEVSRAVGGNTEERPNVECATPVHVVGQTQSYGGCVWKVVLPHIRVDDWVFGVSSVSKDGFESPVASAVPGGAFHPYIAPEKK